MDDNFNIGLTPLKGDKTFSFGTWDVEAADWWHLEMIGCWDGTEFFYFRKIEEFIRHILQHKYRGYRWFAHFGGRYDMNFIFDWLREKRRDVKVSFYCSGAMVLQMSLRYRGMTAKLCDSYRLFGVRDDSVRRDNQTGASLRALGIAFDVAHKKTEIDYTAIVFGPQLIEYNAQDCRCLYEVIERFFEETGVHSETFASHALRVWRKDFLEQTIWKPHDEILDFIRRGYHGGRVEVYKRTSPDLTCYDVNSMYPSVMMHPQPVEYIGESHRLLDGDEFGFVECIIDLPECYIPSLPIMKDKLYFPVGRLQGVWSSREVLEAERRGAKIQKIIRAVYFKTAPIFRSYIEKLHKMKQTAKEPTRTIAKLLMNSLYGKFGQSPTKKVYYTESEAPDGSIPIILPNGVPSGFATFDRTSRSAYLLPHLASAVTSRARLVLLDQLHDSIYYCDTDSVFTSHTMKTGPGLGEWSEVGRGAATFIQPKLYHFAGKWKSKGLDKEQSIDDFVAGNPNLIHRARSIKEALREGSASCAHVHIEKRLRETHPKRSWTGDDTRPWDMGEL